MSCEANGVSIDVEVWKRSNRVTLDRQKMNHWILAVSLNENPSGADVKQNIYNALVRWQGNFIDFYWDIGTETRIVDFDNLDLKFLWTGVEPSPLGVLSEKLKMQTELGGNITQSRGALPGPVPTLVAGNVAYYRLDFAYRGTLSSLPWPVARADWYAWESDYCPINAEIVLMAAGVPTEAPAEKSAQERLDDALKGATLSLTSALFWPGLIIGGVLLAGYMAKKRIDK